MRFIRCIIIVLTSAFIVACSSSNIPQKLDSFVDNAELNSSDYDAEDWQKSMLQYERLVEEYSNSGKEYTDAEKQMTARAMGRYHSLLIKNGVEQSAAYLKELEAILPSYLEGLLMDLVKTQRNWERPWKGFSIAKNWKRPLRAWVIS